MNKTLISLIVSTFTALSMVAGVGTSNAISDGGETSTGDSIRETPCDGSSDTTLWIEFRGGKAIWNLNTGEWADTSGATYKRCFKGFGDIDNLSIINVVAVYTAEAKGFISSDTNFRLSRWGKRGFHTWAPWGTSFDGTEYLSIKLAAVRHIHLEPVYQSHNR